MTVQWDDSLLIGVKEVDEQHKELFERIIALFNACFQGKGRQEVLGTFRFLEEYTIQHFQDEERVMLEYNYPQIRSHKAEHQQFIEAVASLRDELGEDNVTGPFVAQVNRKVVEWIISHIKKEDKALASHIRGLE